MARVRVRRRLRHLPINTLAPNILTVLALSSGLTAIRFALQERWELAVAAVLVAGVLDGLDGRLARLLKGASKFGAELDSLSDMVCFGVAPAVTLYIWSLSEVGGIGWIVVLVLAVCCGLRLARFNTALEDPDRPAWAGNYFTGLSAPVSACMALLPVVLAFQTDYAVFRLPIVVAPWTLFVAFMMVSRVPTFAFKKVRVRRDRVLPTLLIVGVGAAAIVSYPWQTLTLIALAYLATIPVSMRSHARLMKEWRSMHPSPDEDDGGDGPGSAAAGPP